MYKTRVRGRHGFWLGTLFALLLAVVAVRIVAADDAPEVAPPDAPQLREVPLVQDLVDLDDVLVEVAVDRDEDAAADDIELIPAELELGASAFDARVFGGEGDGPPVAARRRLERVLKNRLADVANDVDISAAQARKLELAGRGDIERLFARIGDSRRRFALAPENEKLQVEAVGLQRQVVVGPFNEQSLFTKTLHTVLSDAQVVRLDALRAIRKAGGKIEKRSGSKEVQEIQMTSGRTTDAGLEPIHLLPELKVLGLASTRITDAGLKHLAGMEGLEVLDLTITKVTDQGLAPLATLEGLTELNLSGTEISDAGLVHLREMKHLERLNLGVTQIGDAGLEHLAAVPDLRRLNLNHTRITDAGLERLKGLKRLQRLSLHNTDVSDAGARSLAALVNLRELVLDDTLIGDEGLSSLAKLTNLERLDLGGTRITGAGLAHLYGLKKLRSLDLPRTEIEAAALDHLKQAIPELVIFR